MSELASAVEVELLADLIAAHRPHVLKNRLGPLDDARGWFSNCEACDWAAGEADGLKLEAAERARDLHVAARVWLHITDLGAPQ